MKEPFLDSQGKFWILTSLPVFTSTLYVPGPLHQVHPDVCCVPSLAGCLTTPRPWAGAMLLCISSPDSCSELTQATGIYQYLLSFQDLYSNFLQSRWGIIIVITVQVEGIVKVSLLDMNFSPKFLFMSLCPHFPQDPRLLNSKERNRLPFSLFFHYIHMLRQ
jgi:hypothetical protein